MIWLLAVFAVQAHPADQYISVSSVSSAMLVDECRVDNGMRFDGCVSYILGVADALQVNRITCRPYSDAATLQTVTIARRYIMEHPEKWNMTPSALVQEAGQGLSLQVAYC